MAKQVVRNTGLAAKFNQRKTTQVEVSFDQGGGFPNGINGGVAEIVKMGIGIHGPEAKNAGKAYFMIRGVCKLPESHEGIPTLGMQDTLLLEPLYETEGRKRVSEEEHLDYMIGILQSFGVPTNDINYDDLLLEGGSLATELAKAGLHARFRTWQGEPSKEFPNPRVNVTLGGPCSMDSSGATDDITEVEPVEEAPAEDNGLDNGEGDAVDLAALGEAADAGEEPAIDKLAELAKAAGINADDIPTWSEVATMLGNADGDDPAANAGEEGAEPTKDEVYYYKPPRMRKFVEVEVTSVNSKDHTVSLKNLEDNKTKYAGVKWQELKDDKEGKTTNYMPF